MARQKTLLITDLDNTLWDWFDAWYCSFSAMLARLETISGVPATVLEPEIRKVHQLRGTSEYSHLLNELPSLRTNAPGQDPLVVYDEAIHVQNSERRRATALYPGVQETLNYLRESGFMIVAYTESVAYWTEWRIKHTGLDGVIDVLYSAPDHDLPKGVSFDDLRYGDPDDYGLKITEHRHVERGATKPNVQVLRSILVDVEREPDEAVYLGDSLMKDIAMAQSAGVLDVHAKYGEPQERPEYELLRRVSHWPDTAVEREKDLIEAPDIAATYSLATAITQLLDIPEIKRVDV